jgi:hypothetical protein
MYGLDVYLCIVAQWLRLAFGQNPQSKSFFVGLNDDEPHFKFVFRYFVNFPIISNPLN